MHGKDKKYTMDEYMDMVDKGHVKPGTMRESRQQLPSMPIKRPYFGAPAMSSTYPSKAPMGMANQVKGDLGEYRQMESQKVTRKKLGGRSISNPLHYRKPETAIDALYGPGDKVC